MEAITGHGAGGRLLSVPAVWRAPRTNLFRECVVGIDRGSSIGLSFHRSRHRLRAREGLRWIWSASERKNSVRRRSWRQSARRPHPLRLLPRLLPRSVFGTATHGCHPICQKIVCIPHHLHHPLHSRHRGFLRRMISRCNVAVLVVLRSRPRDAARWVLSYGATASRAWERGVVVPAETSGSAVNRSGIDRRGVMTLKVRARGEQGCALRDRQGRGTDTRGAPAPSARPVCCTCCTDAPSLRSTPLDASEGSPPRSNPWDPSSRRLLRAGMRPQNDGARRPPLMQMLVDVLAASTRPVPSTSTPRASGQRARLSFIFSRRRVLMPPAPLRSVTITTTL